MRKRAAAGLQLFVIYKNYINNKENDCKEQAGKEDLIGYYEWKGNLNLLNIIMIGVANKLPERSERYELHRLLGALLSQELARNEKFNIIEKEYEIPMEENFREDVNTMCNLSEKIEEKAKQEGKLENQIETVIKMHQKGFSEDKIAYILDKDEDEVRAILSGDIR